MHTAHTHCARRTHTLCTLHARIVDTARRHALCKLHARVVHTARTHCAHCTHALCKLHTRTVNMHTVHTVRMHCAHCTVFSQDLYIYLVLLAIPGNILFGASVLAYFMVASWI